MSKLFEGYEEYSTSGLKNSRIWRNLAMKEFEKEEIIIILKMTYMVKSLNKSRDNTSENILLQKMKRKGFSTGSMTSAFPGTCSLLALGAFKAKKITEEQLKSQDYISQLDLNENLRKELKSFNKAHWEYINKAMNKINKIQDFDEYYQKTKAMDNYKIKGLKEKASWQEFLEVKVSLESITEQFEAECKLM